MIAPPVRKRHIQLEGAMNFRDLGGYMTANGSTAWGKIFRSDSLSNLTAKDIETLLDLGLKTVVDLRHPNEVLKAPNVFAEHDQVRYHHNPITIVDPTGGSPAERLRDLDFRAHNIDMIRASSQTFAYLFHLLGDASNYPLVFHCAGGRDRTGVAAALILTAAGVSREDVILDYLLSNDRLVGLMDRMSTAFRAQGIDPEPVLANLELREAYLTGLLDLLETGLGGIRPFLHAIGVAEAELAVFCHEFCDVA